jgi:hydrogenase maturation protease
MNLLVLGYGNPGRGDDGLGPALAEAVDAAAAPGVRTLTGYQLNIEDAADLAETDVAVFVDAARRGPAPFAFGAVEPAKEIAFTTHALDPGSLLALCSDVYRRAPRAFLLAVRGYQFEFGEGLSAAAKTNLDQALAFLKSLLDRPPAEWPLEPDLTNEPPRHDEHNVQNVRN